MRNQQLPQGTRIVRDLEYVRRGHPRQKLDLHLPAVKGTQPFPVIVWIHGGGWENGDKSPQGMVHALWNGFAIASINYRYSQDAPFPAQIQDCKAAVRWLRANAARYRLDGQRIGAAGQSAGGHLAALLGTTGDIRTFDVGENLNHSSAVRAVCDFCGPVDLSLYRTSKPGDTLSKFIGGPIQKYPERVAAANPARYATRGDAAFLVFHGSRDQVVHLRHSQILVAALQKARVPATLHIIPGADHNVRNSPNLDIFATDFFRRHVATDP